MYCILLQYIGVSFSSSSSTTLQFKKDDNNTVLGPLSTVDDYFPRLLVQSGFNAKPWQFWVRPGVSETGVNYAHCFTTASPKYRQRTVGALGLERCTYLQSQLKNMNCIWFITSILHWDNYSRCPDTLPVVVVNVPALIVIIKPFQPVWLPVGSESR